MRCAHNLPGEIHSEIESSDEDHERLVGRLQVMSVKNKQNCEAKASPDDDMITLELEGRSIKFQMDTGHFFKNC